MRMYAIFPDREVPEGSLSQFILNCLRENGILHLRIVSSESEIYPESRDEISLERNEDILLELLNSLERDDEFLTLGWDNSVLLIPFEGKQFNLIMKNGSTFPHDSRFTVEDATEVLLTYKDAYEGFGVESVFPISELR